jgi:hypothetical protein
VSAIAATAIMATGIAMRAFLNFPPVQMDVWHKLIARGHT